MRDVLHAEGLKRSHDVLMHRGWHLEIAEKGLFPWSVGEYHQLPVDIVWCRQGERFLELLFNEWDDTEFRFRKNQSIVLPASRACIKSESGYTILAPEIVLLYKSYSPDNSDYQADFHHASPELSYEARIWLREALAACHRSHPWLDLVRID
jgi:hypothetical protein